MSESIILVPESLLRRLREAALVGSMNFSRSAQARTECREVADAVEAILAAPGESASLPSYSATENVDERLQAGWQRGSGLAP